MIPAPPSRRTRKSVPLWLFALLLLIAMAAATGALWQARVIRSQSAQIAQRDRDNAQLRRRIDELSRAQAGSSVAPPPAPVNPGSMRPGSSAAAIEAAAEAEHRAERLRESLAQSNAEVSRLQALISDLQSRIESANADNGRLSAALEEQKRALADANQATENVRADLNANLARVGELTAANTRLKADAAAGKQSAAQLSKTVSDLEGIFRRREMYLNNALRRYREITEQYRAISGVMDSRRDREATPASSAEISRIQNAVALADEDLKQINALSVQAQRLEKKLVE